MTEETIALEWEALAEAGSAAGAGLVTERAQVFGGWLVRTRNASGSVVSLTFVPDGQFRWDGEDFGEEDYEYDEDEEDGEEEEDEDAEEEEDEEDEDGK